MKLGVVASGSGVGVGRYSGISGECVTSSNPHMSSRITSAANRCHSHGRKKYFLADDIHVVH